MKEWKVKIIEKLNQKSKELKEIKFSEVAQELGYNHIRTNDIKEITFEFVKQNPSYRRVRLMDNSYDGEFSSLVLTELEYD